MNAFTLSGVSALAIEGRGLLIEGPPGSGKSTLALALIDRGAVLIGDDSVGLAHRDGQLFASPPPNIAGKIEVRNVGLFDCATASAAVSLVLQLSPAAPRFIDSPGIVTLAQCAIPAIAFDPAIAAAPIRAEWALRKYGLPG